LTRVSCVKRSSRRWGSWCSPTRGCRQAQDSLPPSAASE
jgi:hypothetical protein